MPLPDGYVLEPALIGPVDAPVYWLASEADILLYSRGGNLVVSMSINRACDDGPPEGPFHHICLSSDEINQIFAGLAVVGPGG